MVTVLQARALGSYFWNLLCNVRQTPLCLHSVSLLLFLYLFHSCVCSHLLDTVVVVFSFLSSLSGWGWWLLGPSKNPKDSLTVHFLFLFPSSSMSSMIYWWPAVIGKMFECCLRLVLIFNIALLGHLFTCEIIADVAGCPPSLANEEKATLNTIHIKTTECTALFSIRS